MQLSDMEVKAFQLRSILEDTQTFDKPMSIATDSFQSETLPVSFMREELQPIGQFVEDAPTNKH